MRCRRRSRARRRLSLQSDRWSRSSSSTVRSVTAGTSPAEVTLFSDLAITLLRLPSVGGSCSVDNRHGCSEQPARLPGTGGIECEHERSADVVDLVHPDLLRRRRVVSLARPADRAVGARALAALRSLHQADLPPGRHPAAGDHRLRRDCAQRVERPPAHEAADGGGAGGGEPGDRQRDQGPAEVRFGRTWPETWCATIRPFIRDGVFGFELFHGAGYMLPQGTSRRSSP